MGETFRVEDMGVFFLILFKDAVDIIHVDQFGTRYRNVFFKGYFVCFGNSVVHPDLCDYYHDTQSDGSGVLGSVMDVIVYEIGGTEAEI